MEQASQLSLRWALELTPSHTLSEPSIQQARSLEGEEDFSYRDVQSCRDQSGRSTSQGTSKVTRKPPSDKDSDRIVFFLRGLQKGLSLWHSVYFRWSRCRAVRTSLSFGVTQLVVTYYGSHRKFIQTHPAETDPEQSALALTVQQNCEDKTSKQTESLLNSSPASVPC